jgi:hypothetical protein
MGIWKNRNLMYRMSEPPIERVKYLKQIHKSVRGTDEAVREFQPKRTLIELSSGRLSDAHPDGYLAHHLSLQNATQD